MSAQTPPSNLAARLWMSGLGLICIFMGSLFVWYLWASYQKACITDSWIETPATIIASKIDTSQLTQHYLTKYRLDVIYEYEFNGKKRTGTKIQRLATEGGDLQKIEKTAELYPVAATVVAFVNPDDPAQAVLQRASKAALYSIWFPCLFIFAGAGIILTNIFRKKPSQA